MNQNMRPIIKADAKAALSGNWAVAILLFIGVMFLSGTFTVSLGAGSATMGFGFLGNVLLFFLMAPITLGIVWWYLGILRKSSPKIEAVFSFFNKEKYLPSLLLHGFWTIVRVIQYIIVTIILVVPSFIFFFSIGAASYQNFPRFGHMPFYDDFYYMPDYMFGNIFLTFSLIFLVFILGAVIYFAIEIFLIRFKAAYNIMADNPAIGIEGALRESCAVMRGNTKEMVVFYLSFLGWLLLTPVTFGLILLYVYPYFQASEYLYIEYFRDKYRMRKSEEERVASAYANPCASAAFEAGGADFKKEDAPMTQGENHFGGYANENVPAEPNGAQDNRFESFFEKTRDESENNIREAEKEDGSPNKDDDERLFEK